MKITVKTPGYQAKTEAVRNMGEKIAEYRQKATEEIGKEMQAQMAQTGKPSTRPVKWDSERQRRAYFATKGFGGGIPYQRTGDYERSFKIEALPDGIKFYSDSAALPFVGGSPFGLVRSGIHTGRWQLLQPVLQDGFSKIKDAHVQATRQAILDSHL